LFIETISLVGFISQGRSAHAGIGNRKTNTRILIAFQQEILLDLLQVIL
jgi:hypothetical protein